MFTFYYRQSGASRKQFVKAISGILEVRPRYTGMPQCAYEIDFVTVTKEGNIEVDERSDTEEVENLIEKLAMMGYEPEPVEGEQSDGEGEEPTQEELPMQGEQPTQEEQAEASEQPHQGEEQTTETMPVVVQRSGEETGGAQTTEVDPSEVQSIELAAETEPAGNIGMTISVPRSLMSDSGLENLKKLVHAKEDLLKQAFAIESTDIEVTDEAISFPWFSVLSPEELKYASQFISGMCRFANSSKRITSKRRREDNPKFAMRVWAIRMGFSGNEYKALRKYLMHRLPGDAAFRFGRPEESETVEPSDLPAAQ